MIDYRKESFEESAHNFYMEFCSENSEGERMNLKKVSSRLLRSLLGLSMLFLLTNSVYAVSILGDQLLATVYMKPPKLNLKSEGKWATIYIELPEGYNVEDINVTTILVDSTIPVDLDAPVVIGDYDGDEVADLMVCFKRLQLINYIKSKGIEFGSVALTVSGELYDGTLFEGSVTIMVSSLTGDVNCDGIVDIYDVVEAAISYDAMEGEPNWNPNANFAPPWDGIDIYDLATIVTQYGKTHP